MAKPTTGFVSVTDTIGVIVSSAPVFYCPLTGNLDSGKAYGLSLSGAQAANAGAYAPVGL